MLFLRILTDLVRLRDTYLQVFLFYENLMETFLQIYTSKYINPVKNRIKDPRILFLIRIVAEEFSYKDQLTQYLLCHLKNPQFPFVVISFIQLHCTISSFLSSF